MSYSAQVNCIQQSVYWKEKFIKWFLNVVQNYYPVRMRRGKVIGRVVVVDTKIAKSGDVCTWASCKHNKYVEFGEKVASVCSESNGTARESHKSCILVGYRSHAHWLSPLCMYFLLMRTTGLVRVGRGRQQHMSKLHDNADARRTRGMCS